MTEELPAGAPAGRRPRPRAAAARGPRRPLLARPVVTGLIGVARGRVPGRGAVADAELVRRRAERPVAERADRPGRAEPGPGRDREARQGASGQAPDRPRSTRPTAETAAPDLGGLRRRGRGRASSTRTTGCENGFQLIAVRAAFTRTGGAVRGRDGARPGGAFTELVRVGAVQCLLHNDPTPAGAGTGPRAFLRHGLPAHRRRPDRQGCGSSPERQPADPGPARGRPSTRPGGS